MPPFSTLADIIARARKNLPLTPAERSLLRLLNGLAVAVAITVIASVTTILTHGGHLTVGGLLHMTYLVIVQVVVMALIKLYTAKGDNGAPLVIPVVPGAPPIPAAAGSVVDGAVNDAAGQQAPPAAPSLSEAGVAAFHVAASLSPVGPANRPADPYAVWEVIPSAVSAVSVSASTAVSVGEDDSGGGGAVN